MKILLIGFFTRTYMPYLQKYEKVLKKYNIDYDVVFFDRDCTKKAVEHVGNEYTYCHVTTVNKIKKLLPVFQYMKFVRKLLKKHSYDRLIIFTTMPAILLFDVLLRKYKNKYIFDYRDTTYEHYALFRKLVNKVIKNSYFTAISSLGYMCVLDKNEKIIFNHNIVFGDMSNKSVVKNLSKAQNITIGFLGYVRYSDVNRYLIDTFKNNLKYKLFYAGTSFSDCDLKQYAKTKNALNVEIIGSYNNKDKGILYNKIDIINSLYSLASSEVKYAIPNRLYDAAVYQKPIITTKGTYLSEVVEREGLGLVIDVHKDDVVSAIEGYVKSFDREQFSMNCTKFLSTVKETEIKFTEKIEDFLL